MTQHGIRLALAWAMMGPLVVHAQSDPVANPSPPPPTLHGTLKLSLAEAIAMGVENNLDVQVERHAPLIAREDLGVAWGSFDPVFEGRGGITDSEIPIASTLQEDRTALEERLYDGEAAITGLVPWLGAEYSLGYTGFERESNSAIATLSPEYRSRLEATLEIPVLRGLFWSEPWTRVRIEGVGVSRSDEAFRTRLMDTVRDIEVAYWRLVATKENLDVAEKSLETARALLELTETQYEVGVVSRVEVTEAEAGVAEREFSQIRDDAIYRNAQDELVDLVLGPYLAPLSRLDVEPTDSPDRISIREVDVEEAAETGLAERPELATIRREIEQQELNRKFARNQRLPEFNVRGSYGYEGLSGRDNPNRANFGGGPLEPVDVKRNYTDTFDDFFSASGAKNWSVMGVFSIPLGNVEGRHGLRRAELELSRAESRLRREEQRVVLEVRRAARDIQAALGGLQSAERRVIAAQEQLRAERVRLEHGESTPFDVLLRESDLVDAEQQRIVAQQTYHNSITDLNRAQGTTLRSRNIVLEDAARLR